MFPLLAALFVAWQVPALRAEEHAFVELSVPRASAFPGETLPLVVRFGVEREFLQHNLLQLFTRPLDVPLQLEIAWSELAGASVLEPAPRAQVAAGLAHGPSFALGEAIVEAARASEESRGGRSFVVLEIDRRLCLSAVGRCELPAPRLGFAYATRFETDLLGASLPLDRASAALSGAPLAIEVLPFPPEGRPRSFTDALGRFALRVEAEPRALATGERLALTLSIEGQGNLAELTPPRLDVLEGFHLLGLRDETVDATRTLRAELVLESPRVHELPSIELAAFDPQTRRYSIARSEPIPLAVGGGALPGAPVGLAARRSGPWFLGLCALAALAIGWGLWRLARRRDARGG